MSTQTETTKTKRQNLLAVIMLALLLLVTAVAWLLSGGGDKARSGERWYLLTRDGAPVGWQVRQRGEEGPLGLGGYIIHGAQPGTMVWARWTLSPSLDEGRYVAAQLIAAGRGVAWDTTAIRYDAGQVVVTKALPGRRNVQRVFQYDVDEKYIPEGRLLPALAEVAAAGTVRLGRIIDDSSGLLQYVVMRPLPPVDRQVAGQAQRLSPVGMARFDEPIDPATLAPDDFDEVYYLDREGGLVLFEMLDEGAVGATLTLTPLEEISELFPAAGAHRARTLREHRWE